jgi:hypothetical protein
VTEGIPPDRLRVSDIDRQAVEARLRRAHTDGSLTLGELDERLLALWQTRTRADLAILTMDLPAPIPPPLPPLPVKPGNGPVAMKVLTAIWLSLSALNLIVWLMVFLTGGGLVYPWFLWVLMPPGAVLGVLWALGVGRSSRR